MAAWRAAWSGCCCRSRGDPAVTVLAAAYFPLSRLADRDAPPLTEGDGRRRAPTFVAGLLLSLVNPKGYAAMAALYSGFVLVPDRLAPISRSRWRCSL